MGHAYTSILCDVATRFNKMLGKETIFLTGTDEHGDKIQKSAEREGLEPQQFVDKVSQQFKKLLPVINVENSDFIRTTDSKHVKVVQGLLQKVYDQDDIYFKEYTGKYCFGCERFLGDDELVDGKCPDHNTEPETISEQNYFFKMSKYWEKLKSHIERNPEFIVPENFRNEVNGLLKQDAQDLCISRPKSRLTWGIELPFDKNFVTYVWFDALINYISGIDYPSNERFEKFWPNSHHVIAKDILKPHCVYWPTMLLSMGIALPKQIAIHGYWLIEDSKMSKSQGKTVDPVEYCEKYGSDLFRFYLMRNMRFGRDANYSDDSFIKSINAELANNLGNLYSRLAGLCKKNCNQQIPAANSIGEMESNLKEESLKLPRILTNAMNDWQIDTYLTTIVNYANLINKYLDETKPWTLAKDPNNKNQVATILKSALEATTICFSWLWPVVPTTSEKVLSELGLATSPQEIHKWATNWNNLAAGTELPIQVTGFPRIE